MNKDSVIQLRTGNRMPVLGLGTWQLTRNTAETVRYALERGFRLIDTSSDYGTQPGIGDAIRNSKLGRKDLYIVTKVEETDDAYSRVESNLKELGVDYADLMLIHRPPPQGAGIDLWEGLIRAKEDGLVRDIGVSNYSSDLINILIDATGEVPVVNQVEWSPFGYSYELIRYCAEYEIAIQAYSPLTRAKRLDDKRLNRIAVKYNKSPAQILIRWNLQIGTVSLPKANQKKHLDQNIDVFDFEISRNDMKYLSGLNEGYSSLWYLPYI